MSLLQLLPMEEQISAFLRVSLVAQAVKNLPAKQETQVGSLDLIAGSGRSPGEGNGNSLQYSCLGNSTGTAEPGGLQSMESQKC